MKTTFKKISDLIGSGEKCPLPLEVIPNYMGINLCSVDAISYQKMDDGQLVNLTIHFLPAEEKVHEIVDPPNTEVSQLACECRYKGLLECEGHTDVSP